MASDLVNSATSEKLTEMDWTKNIEICELVARDQRQAKDVIKAIKKRLSNKNSNVQLYAVLLLEMLMNNIGGPVHRQVIDAGILPVLVKIVKKKSDLPVRERIFLLLDATQTSLGGASGKFPEYYSAYYELVSAGVQFPQRPRVVSSDPPVRESQSGLTVGKIASSMAERATQQEVSQAAPESSILQKASAAMEVLREVLDAVDSTNPEAARDEFTLDLVEQCSFQKERVMHLVLTSRDERLVSQAIELNERLGKVLERHQALLSGRRTPTSNEIDVSGRSTSRPIHTNHLGGSSPKSMSNHVNHLGRPTLMSNHVDQEDTEEEEAEQLTRRMRKGKARLSPEDEDNLSERPFGLLGSSIPSERLNRPLIRSPSLDLHSRETRGPVPNTAIPPPPSKHMERERFFQEKRGDGATLAGHMRGLSLDSRSPSSGSRTGSFGSSE